MKSIIQKIGSSFLSKCAHKNCPVKHPEICPVYVPSPCPNHPREHHNNDNPPIENDKILGRWKPHHDFNKTAIKVDYANVDHCGPCGADDVRNMTNVSRNL